MDTLRHSFPGNSVSDIQVFSCGTRLLASNSQRFIGINSFRIVYSYLSHITVARPRRFTSIATLLWETKIHIFCVICTYAGQLAYYVTVLW